MTEESWAGQARWWAGEYRRRLARRSVRSLSVAMRAQLLYDLERMDALDHEIDLAWPSPYLQRCLVAQHVVAPTDQVSIDPDTDYGRAEGHFWPELSVSQFRDVIVDEQTGLVFHHDCVLTASGHSWRSARDGAFLSGASARAMAGRPRPDTRGPIAPMGGAWNYYHFLLEALPRLLRVLQVEPQALAVFSAPLPSFVGPVLVQLGIRFAVVEHPEPVWSNDVWLCDPTPLGWPRPTDQQLLRETVFASCPEVGEGLPERLFISRRNSSRALQGEDRLESELERRGFVTVMLEDFSFADQVAHLRAADVVIAGHGAGESNIVFMSPGSTVIELTTGEWWTASFRQIAAMRGLHYRLLTLPSAPDYPFGRTADALPAIDDALSARTHEAAPGVTTGDGDRDS